MRDHFEKEWDRSLWAYYNMGSPCWYAPTRKGDSELLLPEFDPFNEGNCLLSRRFVGQCAEVSAGVTEWDREVGGGAIVGFYGGKGQLTDYVVFAVTNDRLEIRIPSGGQRGASFMDGGQPQSIALDGCDYEAVWPFEMALHRQGNRYSALLNGRVVLTAETSVIPGDARALIKAHPREGGRYHVTWTAFDWAEVTGFAPVADLAGQITDESGAPLQNASVHIAGFDDQFALTDETGGYRLLDIPRGRHVVVAAKEGYAFTRGTIECTPGAKNGLDLQLAEETEATIPRREYNNPSFDRSMNGFKCLNGTWQFAFDPENEGEKNHWYEPEGHLFDKAIRVPFSWASLMGFGEEHLASGDDTHEANTCMNNFQMTGHYAWYKRGFTVPADFPEDRQVILHIGASANVTNAWIDGRYLGMRVDEYSDLSFDLGKLQPGSEHTLVVKVEYPHDIDSHNMGKQIFWFSSAPGIWQSVWIEPRNEAYIDGIHLRPELTFDGEATKSAAFLVEGRAVSAEGMQALLLLYAPDGELVNTVTLSVADGRFEGRIDVSDPVLWAYREGNLYTCECALIDSGVTMDNVRTYAGLREVKTQWLPGHSPEDTDDPLNQYQYVYLNNKPFYIIGILDQCYNAFGIYTYRSLEAEGEFGPRGSIAYDVDRTLAYGYNLSRVHIKENEPLWYHECDRRGLPVWTEHPGNFYATPDNPNWQSAYFRELNGMCERLYNHPSIVIISSINESWGVEGRHVSTPWENELRYNFLRDAALRAKALSPHVLVCDNSGFGKTEACEIDDFHYYPHEYDAAKAKWEQLMKDCYPGSIYNYINEGHGGHAIGSAKQTGRPILISEFLHINGIDMQTRMFEKVAGYLRMNVASHEVENSGPMTADRYERDYGYVDHEMRPIGYDMVNNMDMVVFDHNRLIYADAGSTVIAPVYTSHFSWSAFKKPVLRWTVTGIDGLGRYVTDIAGGERAIAFTPFKVERLEDITWTVPEGIKGAYLFAWVEDSGERICSNYIEILVDGARTEVDGELARIHPADVKNVCATGVHGVFAEGDKSLLWVQGRGAAEYTLSVPGGDGEHRLVFEAGAREGAGAIKVTDEILFPTRIRVLLDGAELGVAEPKDDPSDERGLFTNAVLGGRPFNYRELGRFGYGERFEFSVPAEALKPGEHILRFECEDGGMTLYGNGMGRYGFDPMIVKKEFDECVR